ncbi:MAG: PASTA domain-containing protein, partial [bacterium]
FSGKGEEEARKVLADMKFTGTIEVRKEVSTLPKDTIIRTEPPAKAPLGFKDKLAIVVAIPDPGVPIPPDPTKPVEITEKFTTKVPDAGGQGPAGQVYVRVTLENPVGSGEQEIFNPHTPFTPESSIPTLTFKRMSDQKAIVRLYTGLYDANITTLSSEKPYNPTAPKPARP